MKTKNTHKNRILKISLLICIAIGGATMLALNTMAQEVVPVEASRASEGCIWSEGLGSGTNSSELYVPAGSTCEITGAVVAEDTTGYTDYAIIVYSGGVLQVGLDSYGGATTLEAKGRILNMGTIYVGEGGTTAYDNSLLTTDTGSGGNIIIGYDATADLTVNNNGGAGTNKLNVDGAIDVGNSSTYNTPTLNLDSIFGGYTADAVNVWGHMNMNEGTLTTGYIWVPDATGGSAELNLGSNGTINIDSFYIDIDKIALGIGTQASAGSALVNVYGVLNIGPSNGPYTTDDVNVIIGGDPATPAKLDVKNGGQVNIYETNTWNTPATLEDPTNMLYVGSEVVGQGLLVEGTLDTDMVLVNSGYVTVDSGGPGTAVLNANYHYKQASGLDVASDDTMNITGTADVDGDSTIAGTLNVTACTKITNGASESFDVTSTGTFNTNTADTGCSLSNTSSNDGLNVQGADTTMTIANGSGGAGDQTVYVTYGDLRTDDGGYIDANGYFTAEDDLFIVGGSIVLMNDTDSGDSFEADNISVEPSAGGASSSASVESGSVLDLQAGEVNIGTTTSAGTGDLTVDGTFNVPASSSDNFTVGDSGALFIGGGGTVNAAADSTGQFLIEGGFVVIRGTLGNEGELIIEDQELQMNNSTTEASLIIGDPINEYGILTSHADTTDLPSDPGFDFDSGNLDINYHSEATFDTYIDIDSGDDISIGGFLEGTDDIYIGCTVASTCKVEDSGEVKVVGTDSLITVEQSFNLLGELNGYDGEGDILIDDTNSPSITSAGGITETSYALLNGRDITLETNAEIDMSAFVYCYAPGTGTYGGSYGGEGTGPSGPTNATFGEVWDMDVPDYPTSSNLLAGMCGFTSAAGDVNKYGGGSIFIKSTRDITIDGDIMTNGENTADTNTGAGSGGSIFIWHDIDHTDTDANFAGGGTIQANGGDGTVASSYAGGGGRIVIHSILLDDPDDTTSGFPHYEFNGTVEAYGGENLGGDSAAAGTIVYLGDDNNSDIGTSIAGTLIADQDEVTRNPLATNTQTVLPAASNNEFFRVEARNGAEIVFGAAPTTPPVSCFETGTGSSVTGVTCNAYADKPDTMHINNSVNGAGDAAGVEPWTRAVGGGGPGDSVTVADADPEFSVVVRNPELTTEEYPKVEIQVNSASDFGAGTMLWESGDTNNPYVLDDTVHNGERTEDIEYAGDPLTPLTTYYVRARVLDSSDNPGLWTHMDMGNEYKFQIDSPYFDIENLCSDTLTITKDGLGVDNLNIRNGDRYGYGTCEFTIDSSTETNWEVQYGMAPGATDLTGTTYSQTITPINNGGSDYYINPNGEVDVEEYGFNIDLSTSGLTSTNVMDDGTYDFNTSNIFNIEDNGSEDAILEDAGTGAVNDDFVLQVFLNVAHTTYADDYLLDTWMILTNGP